MKDKYLHHLTGYRRMIWQNTTSFHDKNTPQIGHRQNIPQLKAIYKKHTTNIILKGKKLKAFHLRSVTRQRGPLLSLLFNTAEILTGAIWWDKEMKGIQIQKRRKTVVICK